MAHPNHISPHGPLAPVVVYYSTDQAGLVGIAQSQWGSRWRGNALAVTLHEQGQPPLHALYTRHEA